MPIRGLDPKYEISAEHLMRDTRPLPTQMMDALRSPQDHGDRDCGACVAGVHPASARAVRADVAFDRLGDDAEGEGADQMPIQTKLADVNEGRNAKAQGIFFVGNLESRGAREAGKERWLTDSDCRQQFLVLGTTGAGRSRRSLAGAPKPTSCSTGESLW